MRLLSFSLTLAIIFASSVTAGILGESVAYDEIARLEIFQGKSEYKLRSDGKVRSTIIELIRTRNAEEIEDFFLVAANRIDLHDALNATWHKRLPPLHFALSKKGMPYNVIETLLFHGANPNVQIDFPYSGGMFYQGYAAAHIAARMNASKEILDLLFVRGAQFELPDGGGWTASQVLVDTCFKKKKHKCRAIEFFGTLYFFPLTNNKK